jgi:hypothetical protein
MNGSSNRIHIGGLQISADVFCQGNDLTIELLRRPANLHCCGAMNVGALTR